MIIQNKNGVRIKITGSFEHRPPLEHPPTEPHVPKENRYANLTDAELTSFWDGNQSKGRI